MKNHLVAFLGILLLLGGCKPSEKELKNEIITAEKEFMEMTSAKGVADAFYHFADEKAVIKRENDTLIIGRDKIREYYSKESLKGAVVFWTPDYIDVSSSGDMAYTYGKYLWKIKDSAGNEQAFSGVFHTVWKRQKDGSWKYVWD
jgi:ketosteroid isomerase-like protein